MRRTLFLSALAGLLASATAQAPQVTVSRLDGTGLTGHAVRLADGMLELRTGEGSVTVPLADILALHGAAPRPTAPVTARLVGGDEVRGELRGGDAGGETVTIDSRSLGSVSIAVDRLQALVAHRIAGTTDAAEFVLAEEGDHDEALFLPAKRGFDTVFGAIHRFTADGVVFEPDGGAPRAFALDKLAAVALRGGNGPASKPAAQLVTRAGDVVSVDLVRGDEAGVELTDDRARAFTLPWQEVATLLFRGEDRLFLSELQPEAVEEGSVLAGDGEALYPWRRDRNVNGGFLVVGGRTAARGLGVHSRCILTFKVPDGYEWFCTSVGIDDEVRALPARGDVDVAVLVDDQVVAAQEGVRVGAPAIRFGRLAVRGGSKLTLKVEVGAGLDLGDRVDWLHAVLVRKGARRGVRAARRRRLAHRRCSCCANR